MEALIFVVIIFITGFVVGHEHAYPGAFIKSHTDKPYCMQDKAEVMGKSVEIKRCWKAVEVPP